MHTYAAVEYGNLTIMAYDRYVCICKPLHYNAIITKARVQRIILAVWIISFVEVAVFVGPPVGFISFSYIKILVICLKSSKETRKKAFTTCTPHLVSLLNFAFGCFYELITQRFDTEMGHTNYTAC
ncbi:olfactory receptor 4S2-like [Polymixia lowei]